MTTPPAAWHPDPFRRHQLRYWDGVHWTEHVSDQGQTSIDPPVDRPADSNPATEDATPRRVYVDAHLRIGVRHRRLFADEQALWWGEESHPYEGVTALSYWALRTVAAGASNVDYRLRLWRGKKAETITFTGNGDDVRAAYDSVVEALFEHVGRDIVTEAIARVEAGEMVDFAGWRLSRGGAAQGKKQFGWGASVRYAPTRDSARPGTYVMVTEDGKERTAGMFDLPGPNGSLVPMVFDACQRRFGA